MSPDKRVPPLDWSKIEFPSDRITVAQLRKDQPQLLEDAETAIEYRMTDLNVLATIASERELAQRAFAAAMGRADPIPAMMSRSQKIDLLNDDYVRYGISKGLQQTRLLVRELETAAKRQAKEWLGRQR